MPLIGSPTKNYGVIGDIGDIGDIGGVIRW